MEDKRVALIGIDFEDWHQLVRRHAGIADWDVPHDAFARQVHALLDLLDEIRATATFFLLGITAKHYPGLVQEVVARGHEPASHGYAHIRAFQQSPAEFQADVERSVVLIEELTGRAPVGYRAPVFSLNRDTVWAYSILTELGFNWDSSQYDSPSIPRRLRRIPDSPYVLNAPGDGRLLEIPLAVSQLGNRSVPLGGGSYWRVLPANLICSGLRRRPRDPAALYFHPHEFDPEILRPGLPRGSSVRQRTRAGYRYLRVNLGRRRLRASLRQVATQFRLTSYERELDSVLSRYGERTRTLSEDGVIV